MHVPGYGRGGEVGGARGKEEEEGDGARGQEEEGQAEKAREFYFGARDYYKIHKPCARVTARRHRQAAKSIALAARWHAAGRALLVRMLIPLVE